MKQKMSLRAKILMIVLGCWVLPIFTVVYVTGYYISHNLNQQIVHTVQVSADNAVYTVKSRLEEAVVSSRAASYDPTIRNAYKAYRNNGDKAALSYKTTTFLSRQYKYDDKYQTTVLYYCDEPDMLFFTLDFSYASMLDYRHTVHEGVQQLARTLDTRIGFYQAGERVFMVRNIVNSDFVPYAVLINELDKERIFGALQNITWGQRAAIWIGGTQITLYGEPFNAAALGTLPINDRLLTEQPDSLLIRGSEQTEAGLLGYVVGVDRNALFDESTEIMQMLFVLILLVVPLLGAVLWFFYRNVSRPIGGLIAAAGQIEEGSFGVHVQGNYSNREFRYLVDGFNSMSDKLKFQFERIYREELALRDAKLMALQSQINPHFLNNTLEIINWESRLAGNIKVSGMIEALSTMLDAAMDRKGTPSVHLSEEMMYVDAYLYIIAERFGRRLTVKKEIDPETLDLYVPRLVLQPVIENAVEHGIEPSQKGEICIRARREGDFLILTIENNGDMSVEDEARVARLLRPDYDARGSGERSLNLGICNVNQRLRMLYGENSGLTIQKDQNHHTVAKITIAIRQTNQ